MAPHKWYCNGRESGLVRSGVGCRCQPLGLKCWPFRCLEPMDNSAAPHTSKMRIEKHRRVRWYNACHLCALLSCWSSNGSTTKECHHYPKIQSQNFTAFLTWLEWFKLIIDLCVLAPLSSQFISEKMLSAWSSFQHAARHLIWFLFGLAAHGWYPGESKRGRNSKAALMISSF